MYLFRIEKTLSGICPQLLRGSDKGRSLNLKSFSHERVSNPKKNLGKKKLFSSVDGAK